MLQMVLNAFKVKDSIVDQLHSKGYKYVDWTCETGDGSDKRLAQKSEWNWYKDTCKDQKIMVLLMHDYHQGTIDILNDIIKDLKSKGYLILPLSNKESASDASKLLINGTATDKPLCT